MNVTLKEKTTYEGHDGKTYDAVATITVSLTDGFEIYDGKVTLDSFDYVDLVNGDVVKIEERSWCIEEVAGLFEDIMLTDDNRLTLAVHYDGKGRLLVGDQVVYTECHDGEDTLTDVAEGRLYWGDEETQFDVNDFMAECLGWRDVILAV